MDERNLVLEPEQDPFAAVLACGDLSQVMTAIDLEDERAWNTMAFEEPMSDAIQFLRVSAAWRKQCRERGQGAGPDWPSPAPAGAEKNIQHGGPATRRDHPRPRHRTE
jgi:hypothetical protein